jgi:hypothetical protein
MRPRAQEEALIESSSSAREPPTLDNARNLLVAFSIPSATT